MDSKLILISGPSGVGKGPMTDTLFRYAETHKISITKHILYTNRAKRKQEEDGKTYHFADTARLTELQSLNPAGFKTFKVHGQTQGLCMETLKKELQNNTLVLLELYYEQAPVITSFCEEYGVSVKSVFIKPLSDEDYRLIGCRDTIERELVTRAVMQTKLINRATETSDKVLKRAFSAFEEIHNHKGYDYDLANPYGEDNRALWDALKNSVKEPDGLKKAMEDNTLQGIAETFNLFISKILGD